MAGDRKMVDSGVEWIGKVPNFFSLARIKDLVTLISSRTKNHPFYVGMENVEGETGKIIEGDDARTSDTSIDGSFEKGDVLFGKLRPYLMKTWVADRQGSCSTEFLSMRCGENLKNRYLSWNLLTKPFCTAINDQCGGVKMPRADWGNVGSEVIPHPFLPEQIAIASFLDRETTRMDEERGRIKQKIELLKDKRKALIFECVTGKRTVVEERLLAATSKENRTDVVGGGAWVAVPTECMGELTGRSVWLVDSGVEWIGEVPVGWETAKVKSLASVLKGTQYNFDPTEKDGDIPYINGGVKPSWYSSESNREGGIIAISEGGASAGFVQFIKTPWWCGAHCYSVLPLKGIDKMFAFWSLKSSEIILQESKTGTAMPNLQQGHLLNLSLPLPPLPVQIAIAAFLDREATRIDDEAALLSKKNSLLGEQRKALIFETVTGKIDVSAGA